MALKRTNLTVIINRLRQQLQAVDDAVGTFERILEEHMEKKAPRASVGNAELARWFRLEQPETTYREKAS